MSKRLGILTALVLAWVAAAPGLAKVPNPMVMEGETIGRYGGRLQIAGLSDPKTFNYYLATETSSTDVLALAFEGLTAENGLTTEVEPALAERWGFSPDGKVWTFHLRRGVEWHDGKPFTANDVIFSFNLLYDDKIPNNFRSGLLIDGQPLKYEKLDDYTVRFTLPKPYAPLLRSIGIPIVPAHILEKPWREGKFNSMWGVNTRARNIIGTGPYQLYDYQPGQFIVYVRNARWWKVDGEEHQLPYILRLTYHIAENLETMTLQFNNGTTDVHAVRGTEYDTFKQNAAKGNYTVYDGGPTFGTNFVVFNQNPKTVRQPQFGWFTDLNFRRAVAHAVDKASIIRSVYAGRAVPQWSPVSEPNKAFLNTNVRQYPYDLGRSATYLEASGFKKGADGWLRDKNGNLVEFNLSTNSGSREREAISQFLVEDLKKLGIKVNYQPLDFNLLVNQLNSGEGWQAIVIGLTGGVEPASGNNVWLSSGNLHMWNPMQEKPGTPWEARIDELFNLGATTVDPVKRKALYDEWQMIVSEQLPVIYTVAPLAFYAVRKTLQNARPTAFGGAAWNLPVMWYNE